MSGAREIVLEVRGAARRFGSRSALSGIDLTIGSGEIFALIGPNGAGKTTLIKAISGRLPLDSGRIRILGRDVAVDAAARRLFGLVPQAIALYPHLTARENLEVLGRLTGLGRREVAAAVNEALARMSLAERAHDRTDNLSGGMQRRLNIAAGTLHRPHLLLLDEPTVGVDLRSRENIHELLRELRRGGIAILLTTHDLDQAAELADRVAIIVDGRILAEGTPNSLIQQVLGEGKELTVTLAREPDARGRAFLEREGLRLRPTEGGKAWSGPLYGGFERVSQLGARMGELGLAFDEIRVREPGLRSVFFRLTGQEPEP